jgi:hypothetical protein
MSIKKSLIALTILNAGAISAHDKPSIGKAIEKLVGGIAGAAVVTQAEDAIKKYRYMRYDQPTKDSALLQYANARVAMNGAGPARDMNILGIRYNNCNHYGIGNNTLKKITPEDYEKIESRITEKFPYGDNDGRRLSGIVAHRKNLMEYLHDELPKTLKRYAFYRNLALIWGGMHIYDLYQSTKKEKYS